MPLSQTLFVLTESFSGQKNTVSREVKHPISTLECAFKGVVCVMSYQMGVFMVSRQMFHSLKYVYIYIYIVKN